MVIMRKLVCITCCVAGAAKGIVQQTLWQQELFRNVSEVAASLSQSAGPALLEMMNKASFRTKLAACCPSVSKLSATKLLQRLQDEVSIAEVVSGFDAAAPRGNIQPDSPGMSLADGLAGSFFQNVWQDVLLHNETFTESIQEIWKANCSLAGPTVEWTEYSQEGCHDKPSYTMTYPLDVCFWDPSEGGILRYTCSGEQNLRMESWSSEKMFRRRRGLQKPPHHNHVAASGLVDLMEGRVSCPKHRPDWTMDYAADGACHNMTLWNASSMWETEDDAEMYSYGLKPFRVHGAPTSLNEAAERGPYTLVNNLLFDQGSPLFGDVSVVFSASAVRETALISAIDTGTYQIGCVESKAGQLFGLSLNCSAYIPYQQLGTFLNFNHLFLVNDEFWNGTDELLSYFARLEGSWGSWPLPAQSLLHYWEAVPAAALRYPSDVRFLIGSFRALFGSSLGSDLQKWAKQRGWVLVWSLGLNVEKSDINSIQWVISSNLSFPSNERLVDPEVLPYTSARKGLSVSQNKLNLFRRKWEEVAMWRKTNHSNTATAWASQWHELANNLTQAFRIGPLRAGVCSRSAIEPECIGITNAGHCLCYSQIESSMTSGVFV